MLASNLEHGHDNIMQTELPSHADAIFGTVGGQMRKTMISGSSRYICNNKMALRDHAEPRRACCLFSY